jgi:anti-sigma regulatory factor (Ser/Thr protein kinase)
VPDVQEFSRGFPAELRSVGDARRFVRDAVGDVPDDDRDRLLLIVSELATNALLHASTSFEVCVHNSRPLRLDVIDGAPGLPQPRVAAPDDCSGRGLALVEALSTRWGVDQRGAGKCVWCEVDIGD